MLGKRLKVARMEANLMQKEAAQKLGISNTTLSQYEKGQRNPDPTTLSKLANLYGVSVDWLLDRKLEKSQDNLNEDKDTTLSILDLEEAIEKIEKGKVHFGGHYLKEEDREFIAKMIRLAIERKYKGDEKS